MGKFLSFIGSFLKSLTNIQKEYIFYSVGLVLAIVITSVFYNSVATWITKPEVAPPQRLTPEIDLTQEIDYPVCLFKQKECAYDAWEKKANPNILCGDRHVCDL